MSVHNRRRAFRSVTTLAAGLAAVGVCASPAQASLDITPPSVNMQPGLLFKVGTVLSDSSLHPTIPATVTWTATDDVGITAQSGDFHDGVQEYTPNLSASSRRFTMPAVHLQAGSSQYAYGAVTASDAAGNQGTAGHEFDSSLYEEGATTASAGWSTATCDCWSAGAAYRSTKAGASLQYQFVGAAVAVIGDKAARRGKLQVYMDGKLQTTVDTAGTSKNRVVLYRMRLATNQTHTLKLVAASSARVDVDALIIQNGY